MTDNKKHLVVTGVAAAGALVAFGVGYGFLRASSSSKKKSSSSGQKVAVASESKLKIAAVQAAYPEAQVKGYPSNSGVSSQPLTKDETLTGAQNRLVDVKKAAPDADVWIAIENGIFLWIEGSSTYVDQACVLIESKGANVIQIWSEAVPVPGDLVKESIASSGKKTVGEILVERKAIEDSRDPHAYLAKNPKKNRQVLLEAVLKTKESDPLEIVRLTFGVHRNFPKPPVTFINVLPAFRNPRACKYLINALVDKYNQEIASKISPLPSGENLVFLALESRGFLMAPPVALALGAAVGVVRKENKLPGNKKKVEYKKEYGADVFEVAEGTITSSSKVVLVDDLIATGGTLRAASQLVEAWGGQVIGVLAIVDLVELHGDLGMPVAALYGF
eukprot:TRINITY_DN4570_c0_g1_i1.p1 TRINITY_DN4570_c0_g1~~TRINITY_DN4570_c0_g1_i1.p1  ORF type:complete len:390 (-),score=130.13 TRINITY_DN4570_c0_g1_i1:56-1225(-)